MKRLLFALLLIALPLAAQEAKKEDEKITAQAAAPSVQKLFLLKYADPAKVADLLRVFNASVSLNSDMPALVVVNMPGGGAHFLVVWSMFGGLVQLMDPATGRRWSSPARLLSD